MRLTVKAIFVLQDVIRSDTFLISLSSDSGTCDLAARSIGRDAAASNVIL